MAWAYEWDPHRECRNCGASSPRTPVCGECEMYERGFKAGAKEEGDRAEALRRQRDDAEDRAYEAGERYDRLGSVLCAMALEAGRRPDALPWRVDPYCEYATVGSSGGQPAILGFVVLHSSNEISFTQTTQEE